VFTPIPEYTQTESTLNLPVETTINKQQVYMHNYLFFPIKTIIIFLKYHNYILSVKTVKNNIVNGRRGRLLFYQRTLNNREN